MKDTPRPKETPEPLPRTLLATIEETPWAQLEMRPLEGTDWPRGMAYRVRYALPDLGIDAHTQYFAKDYLPKGVDRGRFLNLETTPPGTVAWLIKEIHRFPYGFYFQETPGCWEAFGTGIMTRMKQIVGEWGRKNGDVNGKRAEIASVIAEHVRKKTASQG